MEKRIFIFAKRKAIYIAVCILLAIVAILGSAICIIGYLFHYFSFTSGENEVHGMAISAPLTESDFLTVSGNKIVNQRGEEILLEGVNLGGWLLQEYWMCPVQGSKEVAQWTNLETLNILEERFGSQKTQELVEHYEDNWITEWDIQNIASIGCNVIRIPFWYRNFLENPNGEWISENPEENPGFQRLDWIIETAEKYGMYVILDMHGCPGGQNSDHTSGSARRCELYSNPEYQNAMEKLWIAIASRYKESVAVAAYDIMNEPFVTEIESIKQDPRNIIYNRMVQAIRSVDSNHILMIEGIWTLSVLPDPAEMGWKNVVYEVHPYGVGETDSACKEYRRYSQQYNVPIYVGEYSDMNMLESCREYEIHHTSWTYKGSKYMEETWFMYYPDRLLYANVCSDPYWLIKIKWGNCLSTQFFTENGEILQLWNK